jgi:glycosyltransferase involved in cell wall biosynthesis
MIRAAQYVNHIKEIPKIVDLIDALSLTYKRMLEYPGSKRDIFFSKVYGSEQKRVLNCELQMIQQFKYALLVSQIDRNYLQQYSPIQNVKILSNGVNTKYFRFSNNNYDPYRITFHGNIHYQPNTDAILYFYHNIFPLIHKKEKNAKFYIVGNKPRKSIQQLAKDANVFITGKINDIRPYLMDSSVSICPVRMGAGVQNKILEAMAIGAPVVTSSLGREGIEANSGEHLLVADSPQDFADSVLELMHNNAYRKKISEQARHLIENKYTWEQVLSPLAGLMKN